MADKSLQALTTKLAQIADDTNKSIKPDVKEIKDAVCGGILSSLMSINKKLDNVDKQNRLNKLTGKITSANGNKNLIKNTNSISNTLNKILLKMDKMSDKGRTLTRNNFRGENNDKGFGGLSNSIDAIKKLKNINIKDFILTKLKLKHLKQIMSKSLEMFREFKNQKEVENTMNFINTSTEMMGKLAKTAKIAGPAQRGSKAIQKIFLGGKRDKNGGLLGLFQKIDENKDKIERGKKSMSNILKACGSMFLTSIILTGVAAVAIPAMLGALLVKGVIWLMTGTMVGLSKVDRHVKKGATVLLLMSTSIITFALGLGLMMKAVKDMKLKDIGLMMASIAGVGLTVAGVGLLAVPIAVGSASLLLLSAGLGVFGVVIDSWRSLDTKTAMTNIQEAVGGLRDIFGLELGKGNEKKTFFQRLSGGVMDIAMGVLNFGSSFFIMGQLLLAGAGLGILYKGLKAWDNFNGVKAAKNLEIGIGAVKDAFGLGDDKNGKKEGLKGKLKKFGGKVLDMAIALLQGGEVIAKMGTITLATGMADVIRLTLIPWNKFNAKPAAENLKTAFYSLKDAFGLNDKTNENFGQKTLRFLGGPLDLASTLMSAGGVLVKMGTIMLATGLADIIKLNLKPWENYNGVNAIQKMGDTIKELISVFGLDDTAPQGFKLLHLAGGMLDLATSLLNSGGVLIKMGTIALATGMAAKIKESIMPWENYNGGQKSIENMGKTINGLLDLFGLRELKEAENKSGILQKVGNFFANIGKTVGKAAEGMANAAEGGNLLAKIGSLSTIVKTFSPVIQHLKPWESFNPDVSLKNINKTINGLILNVADLQKLNNGGNIKLIKVLKNFALPFKTTVDTVNALDITKASTVVEIFKAFSDIKDKPIDAFTKAVDKFSESCSDLIESLNTFGESNNSMSNTPITTGDKTPMGNAININNKDELASAIANAIKQLPVNVETNISDVKLVVNNETGRRVVLTLDD